MPELIDRILRGTTGNIELRRMWWDPQKQKYDITGRAFSRDVKRLQELISGGTGDVFHGLGTRRPGATTGRKEDVHEIVCVAIDVDFKATPRDSFEQTLQGFSLKPTVVVDSGNGRHIYWFLKDPILLNGDARHVELIEAIGRGLGKVFGGDSVHDISRVLRT